MLFLDTALALTRGNPLKSFGLLTYLNPSYGVYTAVYTAGSEQPLLGQIRFPLDSRSAHLAFLLPGEACNLIALPALLEHLTFQAGSWGACNLIAEVDEHTQVFDTFRRSGFSIYAWQQIWNFNYLPDSNPILKEFDAKRGNEWCVPNSVDAVAIRNLYLSLVPAIVLPLEPALESHLHGLVYHQKGEVVAYADIIYGPKGIWIQPFFHPEIDNVLEALSSLLVKISRHAERPVYVCVRSYQAWLESALEGINAQLGPRQAVMVKHMAITQKVLATVRKPALEEGQVKPSVQVIRAEGFDKMKRKNS